MKNELKKIENGISNKDGVITFFIDGLPGSGKTELAKYYAHKNKDNYSFVRVFNAENLESLQQGFELLARDMSSDEFNIGIDRVTKQDLEYKEQPTRFVFNRLKKIKKPWLWIFDNVEDYNKIRKYIPNEPGIKGTIIITTRSKYSDISDTNKLNLNDGMTANEAIHLLQKISHQKLSGQDQSSLGSKDDALGLVEDLGRLPSAIATSANYLVIENRERKKQSRGLMSFNDYRSDLEEEIQRLGFEEHEASMNLLISKLSEESRTLLELFAFTRADHIPGSLLTDYLQKSQSKKHLTKRKVKEIISNHPLIMPESKNTDDLQDNLFFVSQDTIDQIRKLLTKEEKDRAAKRIAQIFRKYNKGEDFITTFVNVIPYIQDQGNVLCELVNPNNS